MFLNSDFWYVVGAGFLLGFLVGGYVMVAFMARAQHNTVRELWPPIPSPHNVEGATYRTGEVRVLHYHDPPTVTSLEGRTFKGGRNAPPTTSRPCNPPAQYRHD